MYTTNPITLEDGRVFDRLNVNLAITTRLQEGVFTASAALRLTPARVSEDGSQESLEGAQVVLSGDTAKDMASDADKAALVSEITAAMQKFIVAKGY